MTHLKGFKGNAWFFPSTKMPIFQRPACHSPSSLEHEIIIESLSGKKADKKSVSWFPFNAQILYWNSFHVKSIQSKTFHNDIKSHFPSNPAHTKSTLHTTVLMPEMPLYSPMAWNHSGRDTAGTVSVCDTHGMKKIEENSKHHSGQYNFLLASLKLKGNCTPKPYFIIWSIFFPKNWRWRSEVKIWMGRRSNRQLENVCGTCHRFWRNWCGLVIMQGHATDLKRSW